VKSLLLIAALLILALGLAVVVLLIACFCGLTVTRGRYAGQLISGGDNVRWVKLAAVQKAERPSHVSCTTGAVYGTRTVASGWFVAGSEEAAEFVRQHARQAESGKNGMACEVGEVEEIWLPGGKRPD
jgi:hypothetical protein